MVDPEASPFHVSWQDWDDDTQRGELIEKGGEIVGAEAAIAWGRARSDRVLVRLGHTDDTHFSAGHIQLSEQTAGGGRAYPLWPPDGTPAEGWWTPSDEVPARTEESETELSRPLPDRLGVAEPEIRDASQRNNGDAAR